MNSYEVYNIDPTEFDGQTYASYEELEPGHVTPHESQSQSQSQSQYEETQPEGSQDWVASQVSNIGVSFSCSSVTDEVVLHHIKETYKAEYNTDWWINNDQDVDVDDDAVTVQLDPAVVGAGAVYSQESSVSETPGPQLFPSGLTADDSTVTQEDADSQAGHASYDVSYDSGSQTESQTTFYPSSDTTSTTYAGSFSGSQTYSHYTNSQTTSTCVDSSQSTGRGYDADGEATTSDSDMTYSPSSTILFGSQSYSQSQGSGLDTSTPGVDIYDPLTFDISPGVTHSHYEDIDPSSQGSEPPVDKDGNVFTQHGRFTAQEFQAGGFHRNGRVRTPLIRTPSPDPE